ncbi:molybdenum ABC transporter ATP-binding protein [Kineobactrum salinum]|uniref:Molybdenum ABC transporter ATP-binding protein n=1 Tax=Kineobactrum salinum TaxID=2708301 RepID=A0A6C0U8J2_9GAMM|nr:molybdenum ABC transporter ATP-binding protein [Kineobactrum salinum]QIB65854.1 molybdenum ABC transporter ATP-binding protein [Kineobactrum salinum]
MSSLTLDLRLRGADGFLLQVNCRLPGIGVTGIYGPSGSGKTTLLHCIAGLRRGEDDSVVRFGHHSWQQAGTFLQPWQRDIGFVFQDARLFPHLSVEGNLRYAARRAVDGSVPPLSQVASWLALEDLLERAPDTLSAGQRQRVAIARAILRAPRLLLLDEPLANLDAGARQQCLLCLQRLQRELQLPMLYVSHDIAELSQLAEHLLLLRAGQVEASGPLLELCGRVDLALAQEPQAAALLLGQVRHHDLEYGLTELEVEGQPLLVNHLPAAVGEWRRIRIPARDISVCRERPAHSSILNILPVTLQQMQETGSAQMVLRLAFGQQFLLARITRRSASTLGLRPGEPLYAQIKSAALLSESHT